MPATYDPQLLREVGLSGISEGTVYPLARLEREGRISARLVSSSAGPVRQYYQSTPDGYAALTAGTAKGNPWPTW